MLSIIAVVINNLEITKRFVSSIRQYTSGNYELILIDNESINKETINYIKEVADVHFRFEKKADLSKAWNQGIFLSKGEYIAVANNDTIVSPKWYERLKETLDSKENAGMVSPITISIIREGYLKHGCFKNFDKTFSKPFKLEKFKDVVWGEFYLFKKQALINIGGYCELYKGFGAEDLEACFQLFSKGYDIYIDPRVFVHHEGMATKNKIPKVEREKIDNENFELFKSRWPKYAGDWK